MSIPMCVMLGEGCTSAHRTAKGTKVACYCIYDFWRHDLCSCSKKYILARAASLPKMIRYHMTSKSWRDDILEAFSDQRLVQLFVVRVRCHAQECLPCLNEGGRVEGRERALV